MRQTIALSLIDALCSGARHKGLDQQRLLQQLGSDKNSLSSSAPKISIKDSRHSSSRLPAADMGQLTSLIRQQLQDESLGFLQQPLKPGSHEYSCRASINSRNVREAYQHTINFFNLVTDDIRFELVEYGDSVEFQIHYQNPNQLDASVFIGLTILTIHRWINWLCGKKILLNQLSFAFDKPSFADEYKNMFSCEHLFQQPYSCMVFDRRSLDHAIIQTAEDLEQLIPKFPDDMISRFKLDNSLSRQVQRMLQAGHQADNLTLSLQQVADQLHTSVDTLRRRLKEEGNAFAEIKQSVRRNTASFWLSSSDTAINTIALRLGFSEPSAFNRAYKKWTGMTPGEYRKANSQN